MEYLIRECERQQLHLVPPQTITPGHITDLLFDLPTDPPIAITEESQLAWTAALRDAPPENLETLMANPPPPDDVLAWHELAHTISRLHRDLAGYQLTFNDAADAAERLELLGEAARWRSLQDLHHRYTAQLSAAGLACPYAINVRRLRLAESITEQTHVALISIVELNANQRLAVNRLADAGVNISALVHAPQSLKQRFDELGCVLPQAWLDEPVHIDEQLIAVTDRPSDQAQQAIRFVAGLDGKYAAAEITIGVSDADLVDPVQHAGEWAGLAIHAADGVAITRTLPYRLLDVIARWLDGNRFADFASLLRHPDVERWLRKRFRQQQENGDSASFGIGDWIGLLDRYFSDHLHQRLDGSWLGSDSQRHRLKHIYTQVQHLLKPLISDAQPKPLAQWGDAILLVLRELYSHRKTLPYQTREACNQLRDVLTQYAQVNVELQPSVTAATALRLLHRQTADLMIAQPDREGQIEMLGWLELHLDPAPAMVLLGINDGKVPAAVVGDQFLPDSLRIALGLPNNTRRYARDAYLLQATINSRENLLLVAGRSAADGEPLAPSRLLLACDPEQLPARVALLCNDKHARRWPTPIGAPQPSDECHFMPLPPPPSQPPALEKMSVTSFRAYLNCPYRFWLSHIERLRAITDDADELDPLNFGSLAHHVLERFGKDESIRISADEKPIAEFLHAQLDQIASDEFGRQPVPAVRVQLERLRRRLDAFAREQAKLRQEGWIIVHSEYVVPEESYLDVPGQPPMRISGKIDRIDQHEIEGTFRLIDYKTSEQPATPFETHHGGKKYRDDRWIDLQLPLYRFLAHQHGYHDAEVGYIVLPKQPEKVAYLPGTWTDEQFETAIDKARQVVMDIRAGLFDPNPDYRSSKYDDFATICRISVLGGDDDPEGDN